MIHDNKGNLAGSLGTSFNNDIDVTLKTCPSPSLYAFASFACKGKGKVFPYSLPSVGPGADPGVQAVSPQVT